MVKGYTVIKQVSVYGLAGLGVLCLIILLLSQWLDDPLKHQIQSTFGLECSWKDTKGVDEVAVSNEIQRLIDADRRIVRDEMMGYHYPNGMYNISAGKLEDLLIEENGQPVRSIVVTRWRSGSTFFSEILGSHPGNYFHYEPFADYGMGRVRDQFLAEKAIKRMKALLNCDYADLEDDCFEFMKRRPLLINRSTYLWEQCYTDSRICYDRRYLSSLCKLFPFQAMKLTHLRLQAAEELLADEKFAVRLVLLVRDPRGTLQSGKYFWLCPESPDCSEPALVCADLVSDYKTAVKLRKAYPNTFRPNYADEIAICIGIFNNATAPAMRSIISTFVPAHNVGKVFTMTSLVEVLSLLGGTPLHTMIYSHYLPPIYPSPVYMLSTTLRVVLILCVVCIEVLIRTSRKPHRYAAATTVEDF